MKKIAVTIVAAVVLVVAPTSGAWAVGTPSAQVKSSSGGSGTKPLPSADYGDIFWWDSKTDHVGLYRNKTQIVHAPGINKKVTVQAAKNVKAPKHTKLMYVNNKAGSKTAISKPHREAAAMWAGGKVGKPYNSNFAKNKKVEDTKYNCSQLVWAAYKAMAKVDLDGNGGLGVYPGDIVRSNRTVIFKNGL